MGGGGKGLEKTNIEYPILNIGYRILDILERHRHGSQNRILRGILEHRIQHVPIQEAVTRPRLEQFERQSSQRLSGPYDRGPGSVRLSCR